MIKFYKKNRHLKISKNLIEELNHLVSEVRSFNFVGKHTSMPGLLSSLFFLKKGDPFKTILELYKTYTAVYRSICSILLLFKDKTRVLNPPININNLNVSESFKIVKEGYKYFLVKSLKSQKG